MNFFLFVFLNCCNINKLEYKLKLYIGFIIFSICCNINKLEYK